MSGWPRSLTDSKFNRLAVVMRPSYQPGWLSASCKALGHPSGGADSTGLRPRDFGDGRVGWPGTCPSPGFCARRRRYRPWAARQAAPSERPRAHSSRVRLPSCGSAVPKAVLLGLDISVAAAPAITERGEDVEAVPTVLPAEVGGHDGNAGRSACAAGAGAIFSLPRRWPRSRVCAEQRLSVIITGSGSRSHSHHA
jgi:hypothetical protein